MSPLSIQKMIYCKIAKNIVKQYFEHLISFKNLEKWEMAQIEEVGGGRGAGQVPNQDAAVFLL
jgi:hypothetical protein